MDERDLRDLKYVDKKLKGGKSNKDIRNMYKTSKDKRGFKVDIPVSKSLESAKQRHLIKIAGGSILLILGYFYIAFLIGALIINIMFWFSKSTKRDMYISSALSFLKYGEIKKATDFYNKAKDIKNGDDLKELYEIIVKIEKRYNDYMEIDKDE